MATLNQQAQGILAQFGQQSGVSADQLANLSSVINSSPTLIDQVNAASVSGELRSFQILPAGTHAGGTYDPATRAISLPAAMLTTPVGRPFDMGEPVFVLGHELEHGLNRQATQNAYTQSKLDMEAEARRPASSHDYTNSIEARIAQNRKDESTAEIAGFNAIVGHVKARNANATLADVYAMNPSRMGDFIDRSATNPPAYTIKPNLSLGTDMSLAATSGPAGNIEGMGQNYFDKAAAQTLIGHLGNSDYRNYYGASAISLAAQIDTACARPHNGVQPSMVVDMQRLGLSEKLLEENGIFLGRGQPSPKPYEDGSRLPHTQHQFDHTSQTHTHLPSAPGGGVPTSPLTPADPGHPNYNTLQQIRGHVRGLDEASGRPFDHRSEQLSHSLLTLARDNGMTRVDHVIHSRADGRHAAGEDVFVVQGRLNDPAHVRASTNTELAASTPVAESNRQLAGVEQRLESQQAVQPQAVAQSRDQGSQENPHVMRG